MIGIKQVLDDDEVVLISAKGKVIRLRASDISVMGRNTQGVKLIGMDAAESVVGVAILSSKDLI